MYGRLEKIVRISTHAPRTGSDPSVPRAHDSKNRFQPTLPARGATMLSLVHAKGRTISTHAPRTGSDLAVLVQQTVRDSFQPTLPARGATGDWIPVRRIDKRFQPTLPARGATLTSTKPLTTQNPISTHAPRTGSDAGTIPCSSSKDYFNPRSPHGERPACSPLVTISNSFQPTLPARGATTWRYAHTRKRYFNPRSPHGERHSRRADCSNG